RSHSLEKRPPGAISGAFSFFGETRIASSAETVTRRGMLNCVAKEDSEFLGETPPRPCRVCGRPCRHDIILRYTYNALLSNFQGNQGWGYLTSRKYGLICEECGTEAPVERDEVKQWIVREWVPISRRFGPALIVLVIVFSLFLLFCWF